MFNRTNMVIFVLLKLIFFITVSIKVFNEACQNGRVTATELIEYCRAVPSMTNPSIAQCRPLSETLNEYTLEVFVASGRGISNQCDVQVTIVGTNGESRPISISSFYEGTKRKQKVSLDDIGSPTQVIASFTGTSTFKWKCKQINIYQSLFWWSFDCIGTLDEHNKRGVYHLSGNKRYTIAVATGSNSLAGTQGTIEINLKGEEERETGMKILSEGLPMGSNKMVVIRGADIGKIQELVLHNTAVDDPWYCSSITIRGDDGNVVNFPIRRWIGLPYEVMIHVSSHVQHLIDSPAQDIECFTRATDIFSGYPEKLDVFKVRCPMYCDTNTFGLVRGSSLHPSTSSICQSGILDGVLSSSGGELVVTVMGSLPSYYEPEESLTNIQARDYEPSLDRPVFSYFLYQSYSIDNIEKNIRVVDAYGKLVATGRLEFRRKGIWGAVCSKGELGNFNQMAARLACQEMGFLHGTFMESGCSSVNTGNVCSQKGYRTVAAAVQCTGHEKSVLDCTYEEPSPTCLDHLYDVAIQCTNFPLDREPLPGTIRLVDATNAPSLTGVGRLEYYLNGWGSVCHDGFTTQSELVACRQMGYTTVKHGGYFKLDCKDINGENLCSKPTAPINVVNLACSGTEKNVRDCPHVSEMDIYCVHEEDIVIGCEGSGDSSGLGLYKKEEFPDVSVRPFPPLIKAKCDDRVIHQKNVTGGPGSTFIVQCPEGCTDDLTEIRGTFIYTDDSSICRAAIHAEAISNSGGKIILVLGYGQKSFLGSLRAGIQSSSYGPYSRSFMISKMIPSIEEKILSPIQKNIYSHYAGESLLREKNDKSFLQNPFSEYVETHVKPIFSWCPPPGFSGFHHRPNDFVDASKFNGGNALGPLNDFTISVIFRATGRQGTWRTLLAHTECNGFSLDISDTNELIFQQMCAKKAVTTGFHPELGSWYHVIVTFLHTDRTVGIFVNGRSVAYETTNYVFSYKSPLTVGRCSYIDVQYFEGDIKCLRIFDFVMNPNQITHEKKTIETSSKVCPQTNSLSFDSSTTRYTVDGRVCLSSCFKKNALNGSELSADFSTAHRHSMHPSFNISCDTTLMDERFNGGTGDKFRLICPDNCCSSMAAVYGTDFYSSTSSICRAALHKGVLGNKGKEILITLQNGLVYYEGSLGHNFIESQTKYNPQSRSFSIEPVNDLISFTCLNDASFFLKMPLGTKHMIQCSSGCRDANDAFVYGSNNKYSPASSVCKAAIHAGVLTNSGGQVELKIAGDGSFQGATQNNIVSLPSDYYLRSFSFSYTTKVKCLPYSLTQRAMSNADHVPRTHLSMWKAIPSPSEPLVVLEFLKNSSKTEGSLDTVSLAIRNVYLNPLDLPSRFVLRNFNCDEYSLYSTMTFTSFPSVAGFTLAQEDNGKNFILLTANITESSGKGVWQTTKFTNNEPLAIGNPVIFDFSVMSPVHVHMIGKGPHFQAWALNSSGKKQMIANFQQASSSWNEEGQIGIHAYVAQKDGVLWTNFELTVSPLDETRDKLPSFINSFKV